MSKYSYQSVNYLTGEVEVHETAVDISLLQGYNEWVVNSKLNPPEYSPEEYAKFLEVEALKKNVETVLERIDYYCTGNVPLDVEIVQSFARTLRNEE